MSYPCSLNDFLIGRKELKPISYMSADYGLDLISGYGDKSVTYTRTAGPYTYFDANGVMQVQSSADVPVFTYGVYTENGWLPYGSRYWRCWEGSTNYVIHSIFDTDSNSDGLADNWTFEGNVSNKSLSLRDISDKFNIGENVNSQRIVASHTEGDSVNFKIFQSGIEITTGDTVSGSILYKLNSYSGNGMIRIYINSWDSGYANTQGSYATINYSDSILGEWLELRLDSFNITNTAAIKRIEIYPAYYTWGSGDAIDIEFFAPQVEKKPIATPFIPTTTATATRYPDVCKYATLGNRSASVESCVFKGRPGYANDVISNAAFISEVDTKRRKFAIGTNDDAEIFPNFTDSSSCSVSNLINTSWSAHDLLTLGYNVQSGTSPYVKGFYNGVSSGTPETTDDFTPNEFGTYQYLGCKNDGTEQFNGDIASIAFYNKLLTAQQHLQGYNTPNGRIKIYE